jgi:hypothetical protein
MLIAPVPCGALSTGSIVLGHFLFPEVMISASGPSGLPMKNALVTIARFKMDRNKDTAD